MSGRANRGVQHLCLGGILLVLSSASVWAQTGAPMAADAPKPELIGEGTISTVDDEFGGSLSSDGTSLYYDITVPPHYLYVMCESRLINGRWQKPEVLPFSGLYRDSDPVLTPDGHTLLYASDRPRNGAESHNFYNGRPKGRRRAGASHDCSAGPSTAMAARSSPPWRETALSTSRPIATRDDSIFIVRGWWMESMRPRRILAPTSMGRESGVWKR